MIWRLHTHARDIAALLLGSVVLLGVIGAARTDAASSTTVVSMDVPSATWIDGAGCVTNTPGVTNFGVVLPGTSATTSGDCTVSFGSSNDTAMLLAGQRDALGRTMVPDAANNAVAMWPFEGSGADTSTTGNAQVLGTAPNDPGYVAGRAGSASALDLDGNDHASAPTNVAYDLDVFTVEVWFRIPSLQAGATNMYPVIVSRHNGAATRRNFSLLFDRDCACPGPTLDFELTRDAGTTRTISENAPLLLDGAWHYAAMVVDAGGTMRLYIDGTQRASQLVGGTGNVDNPAFPVRIGSHDGASDFLLGAVDDVRISPIPLSAADVLARWNGTHGLPDYDDVGGNDWATPAATFFGACLRTVGGTAVGGGTGWTVAPANACTAGDGAWWRSIPASLPGSKIASIAAPDAQGGGVDPSVGLRFGIRATDTQAPGTYVAPLTFTVVAPAV